MLKSVFNYHNYKTWLSDWLNFKGHGSISHLAQQLNCQRSYLSQVLNTHVHFTPDQGFKAARLFFETENERKFFTLLLDWERAGDAEYRAHLKSEIENLRQESTRLEKLVGRPKELKEELAQQYYSSWYWTALHIATSLVENHPTNRLAEELKLDVDLVESTLQSLVRFGLVETKRGRYQFKSGQLHLKKTSPLLANFHMQWRQKAISAFAESKTRDGIHYTVVQTLSQSDYADFCQELQTLIRKFENRAGPSPAETMVNFNIDLRKVL